MNLVSFMAALRSRAGLALGVLLLTVGAALGASWWVPRAYVATATVIVDQGRPDPLAAASGWQPPTSGALSTQMDIIRSDRVAVEVVRRLDLSSDPNIRQAWEETQRPGALTAALGADKGPAPAGPVQAVVSLAVPAAQALPVASNPPSTGASAGAGLPATPIESWIAERLLKALDVKPARDSDVLSIHVRWGTPERAAALANAFAQVYLDTSVRLRADQARRYAGFFEGRVRDAREQLEQSQARLSSFQRVRGVVVGDDRLDIENARLNELSSQLTSLQAAVAESGSRQTQSQGSSADRMQEVLSHPAVLALRSDLTRAEARVQELNARLGDNHPQVLEAGAQVGLLRSRLETETRRVAGGASVSNTINRQRESEVRSSLDSQRQRVLNLKAVRDEGLVLARDVDGAQRSYESLMARLQQSSLESQATQGRAHLLSAAQVPLVPATPGWPVRAGLALGVGLLLALGAVALAERADARARLPLDTARWLGVPLLGVLPGPGERGAFAPNKSAMVRPWHLGRLPAPPVTRTVGHLASRPAST